MTKSEAHELLNAAQAGLMVSSQSITEALVVTGDLAPCRRGLSVLDEQGQIVPMEDRRLSTRYIEVIA